MKGSDNMKEHAKVEDLCKLTNFVREEWERKWCMLAEMDEKTIKLKIQV